MNDDFLLVNKSILPDVLPKVIEARDKINRDDLSITEACKAVGISGSVYYKYKDVVFLPEKAEVKRAILSLKVDDKAGVLNSILKVLTKYKANVLTIFQDTPVRGLAYITIKLDIKRMTAPINKLTELLKTTASIRKAELISYE
ncbi:MAG: ACT domain-containing protein [Bacilli bacterium]